MGNAAGVETAERIYTKPVPHPGLYNIIERRVNSGFFADNVAEYRSAVTRAIRNNDLDILQVLIPAGNIKAILPLHIAASMGALEAIELLTSAGFSLYFTDKQGRAPLHLAAACTAPESVLCVTLLCYLGKKAIDSRDDTGSTPLLTAVRCNNGAIVQCLLDHGASLTVTDFKGQSPRNIAHQLQHHSIVAMLDAKRLGSSQAAHPSSAADEERIMLVWERFFENAFLAMAERETAADANFEYNYGLLRPTSSLPPEPEQDAESFEDSYDDPYADRVECVMEWFSWVLCYNDSEYYVVNQSTYQTTDVQCHLQEQKDAYANWFYDTATEEFPTTLEKAVRFGWMMYFDHLNNIVVWYNFPQNASEHYLPIGDDANIGAYDFPSQSGYSEWVQPDQLCTTKWLLVYTEDGWYYYNALSGHTQWEEPLGWRDYIERCDGWILCSTEALDIYYW